MTGLKDCKSCQENVSLFRAKGKLDEKNEWKFSLIKHVRSFMLPYTSQIAEKVFFIRFLI